MVKLNAQDASFLALEGPAAPMHIAFLLTFRLPDKAPVDYMQKLHDRLMRFPVEVAPFNLRLKQHERLPTMRPELEVDEAIDLEYHLRHEALPWPGGERELGLAISRLHSLPLERSRPLWEFTLIEGLQPRRFALYIKIHHALVDGVGLMHQLTQILAESPRGASPPPWAAPLSTEAPQKATQAADEDWRSFFEGLLGDIGKPGPKRKAGSYIPRGPRCILNGNTTSRRRFATQWLALARVKAVAKAVDATVNDVVLALCRGLAGVSPGVRAHSEGQRGRPAEDAARDRRYHGPVARAGAADRGPRAQPAPPLAQDPHPRRVHQLVGLPTSASLPASATGWRGIPLGQAFPGKLPECQPWHRPGCPVRSAWCRRSALTCTGGANTLYVTKGAAGRVSRRRPISDRRAAIWTIAGWAMTNRDGPWNPPGGHYEHYRTG